MSTAGRHWKQRAKNNWKKVDVNETLSMQCSQELFNTEWRRKRSFAPAYEGNMLTRTTDRMDYNVFDYITVVTAG